MGFKNIIIDTNIIQYYISHPEITSDLRSHLNVPAHAGMKIAISAITKTELLETATEQQIIEANKILDKILTFKIYEETLEASVKIRDLYVEHTKKKLKNIDIGDCIIAATSIFTQSLVYTCNRKDFPDPFFTLLDERQLTFSDVKKVKTISSYFLAPKFSPGILK